ncbi:MAG TPA: hypothetical protein VFJ87_06215 [Rhodanobacteraceae bacterium]|nr:hypothetical protein [Rhodanobacteraceae bacterium]
MAKALEKWEVQHHGPLREVDEGILTVEGTIRMPLGNFPRRMTVVALAAGGTIIFSAIALGEADMRSIEAFGTPKFMVVPSAHHRLDAKVWKQRYPDIRVLAPAGARANVQDVVNVDATTDIFADAGVTFLTVGGTGEREAALLVTRSGDKTLVSNDVIAHVAHPDGLGAKVMARFMGFGVKRPQVPGVVQRVVVNDKHALAAQFREWSRDEDLRRIIVSHGDIIEQPRAVLASLAETLEH